MNQNISKAPFMGVLFFIGLSSVAFAAAGDANQTIIGKSIDYLITDMWNNVGVMAVDGIIGVAAIKEAFATKTITPVWYGLGAIIGVTAAFSFGPDMLAALKAKSII